MLIVERKKTPQKVTISYNVWYNVINLCLNKSVKVNVDKLFNVLTSKWKKRENIQKKVICIYTYIIIYKK